MMDTPADIAELAGAARNGDREAIEGLIEKVRPYLFAVAYAELRNYHNAQDAVSSAVLRICLCVDGLRDEAHARGWLRQIVLNEAHKVARRNPHCAAILDDLPADAHLSSVTALKLDIDRALRRLPRDNARVLSLFYLGGVSITEIARRTQRPVGTIKRWLHEGRGRLAKELEDYAPMKPSLKATLFSSDLPPETVDLIRQALIDSGFGDVSVMAEMPELVRTGEGDATEFHLPDGLRDTEFVILDEQVGGRSAFELWAILKAAAEWADIASGILLTRPSSNTIFAAWAAGFDLCLGKGGLADLPRFCEKIREQIEGAGGR